MATVEAKDRTEAAESGSGAVERSDKIDFKMVTFSLAGKDYGIDIMNVKEIAHAGKFTYVPNAASFVRGVYNLRGEIISVIDLRTMFHLPAERKSEDALESLLILRVGEHVFGVIVDSIDKVVGISRAGIQPPHPIFGDINVKFIRGVVENLNRLYIILDIARIFAPKGADETAKDPAARTAVLAGDSAPMAPQAKFEETGDLDFDFIRETLLSFKRFGVTPVNQGWVKSRVKEWKTLRKDGDLQLHERSDADQFLEPFASPCSGRIWSGEYMDEIQTALPAIEGTSVTAWNPGCGKGFETWSFACLLHKKYPGKRIKVWAHDSDLLNISTAPNIVFDISEVPDSLQEYLVKGKKGFSFNQVIRDAIGFEYHDILHSNPIPPVDIILCRDTLSYFTPEEQARVLDDFREKLKPNGLVITGAHESLADFEGFKEAGNGSISAFARER